METKSSNPTIESAYIIYAQFIDIKNQDINQNLFTPYSSLKNQQIMKTINEKQSKKLIQEYPFYLISFQGENILENFNNTLQVKESLTESYYLYTYDSEELLTKDLLLQLSQLNLLEGNDDQFFDYNPDNLETIFNGSKLLTNKFQQQEILQKLAKLIETFYEESDNQEMIDIYAKFYLPILELKYNIQPNQK